MDLSPTRRFSFFFDMLVENPVDSVENLDITWLCRALCMHLSCGKLCQKNSPEKALDQPFAPLAADIILHA